LLSATSLPAKDSNGFSDPYVKIHLLPGVAKATKLRSRTVYKNLNPVFNEVLHYDGINESDLDTKTLRLVVWLFIYLSANCLTSSVLSTQSICARRGQVRL
jgi:double C2-like domain-containing protein beta